VNLPVRLGPIDISIIAVYLVCITLFGLRFRKANRSLRDYFLADRKIPWWAIMLSIVAAETSTLTIIGTPSIAYDGNLGFLQVVMGFTLGRVLICVLLIPQYFRGEFYTAYQLIERRFGSVLHKVTAFVFLLTRAVAEGVRVWAVAIVVGVVLGTGDIASVAIITLLTLFYTFEGGLAAVIWTDVVQIMIYVTGTVIGFVTLLHLVPGGWQAVHAAASQAGKLQVFDFSWNFFKPYTFWAGLIGGMFLNTASHGVDQLLVQRLLAARNQKESTVSLLASGIVVFAQFTLFLLVGIGLWMFYRVNPAEAHFTSTDTVFPTFIVRHMPVGISGLLIAAILAAAMSNLSAALNSLSSTTVIDFYLRLKPKTSDRSRMLFSRGATLFWGVVLFALALASRKGGKVLELGIRVASVAYGGLLGVFLLGVLTKRAKQTGAMIGMMCGLALDIYLWQFTKVPYTWWVILGSAVTFVVGYCASLLEADASYRKSNSSVGP